MLRFVSTLEYCPVDSTVFLVSPFDIRRPIRNQMVAPRLVSVGYSLQISNERRLRTHAQRPTHSPSNRRLFLGISLCQGNKKEHRPNGHAQFIKIATNPQNNERRLCTHTQDPLTALLAIGVSSSVDLSVWEQERAEAAPSKKTTVRLSPSGRN